MYTCVHVYMYTCRPTSHVFEHIHVRVHIYVSLLLQGGYIVTVELKDASNNDKVYGCAKLEFDISARDPCPAVLQRLNACPP